MPQLFFTSILGEEHRDTLERLMFFNANQARASTGLLHVVKEYGLPKIHVESQRLRIELSTGIHTQTLFVFAPTKLGRGLVGVVVYTREDDALVILFIALDSRVAARGASADPLMLIRMLQEVKAIAARVGGITMVRAYIGRTRPIRMTVKRQPVCASA